MSEERSSVEGVLAYLPTPILPKIGGEPTRKLLIKIHLLISGNAVSVASNLGGGQHRHLSLTMMADEYTELSGLSFVPPHNPGNYPQIMGNAQEQALGHD